MSAPRIQIYEKVLTFTVLFSPCIGYYVYFIQGQDDRRNELEATLREKYSSDIRKAKSKREDLSTVLQRMNSKTMVKIDQGVSDTDVKAASYQDLAAKADELMKNGKGTKKRHFRVDSELYGTEEGAAKRDAYLKSAENRSRMLKKKARRKKKISKVDDNKSESHPLKSETNFLMLGAVSTILAGAAFAATAFIGKSNK